MTGQENQEVCFGCAVFEMLIDNQEETEIRKENRQGLRVICFPSLYSSAFFQNVSGDYVLLLYFFKNMFYLEEAVII